VVGDCHSYFCNSDPRGFPNYADCPYVERYTGATQSNAVALFGGLYDALSDQATAGRPDAGNVVVNFEWRGWDDPNVCSCTTVYQVAVNRTCPPYLDNDDACGGCMAPPVVP